jgi:hypothetical protein
MFIVPYILSLPSALAENGITESAAAAQAVTLMSDLIFFIRITPYYKLLSRLKTDVPVQPLEKSNINLKIKVR